MKFFSMFFLSLIVIMVFITIPASAQQGCEVNITSPADVSVVPDNNKLSNQNLFAFTVTGTVTNLGNNVVCVYQIIPGGAEWWRSGEPIGQDMLGPNGKWSTEFASCGDKNNPHPKCQVKAVVQSRNDCPTSGSPVQSITNKVCESANYTYSTR